MIQASVGWQCPECVRRSAGSAPVSRHRFNAPGRRATGSLLQRAPVTLLLIAVNVVVFILSKGGSNADLTRWGDIPAAIQRLAQPIPEFSNLTLGAGQTYRLFTAPWLHVNVEHIGLNMLSLYVVGVPTEAALGKARFLVLYLAAAMGGSVFYYLVAPPVSSGVGASGAIFGIFGAFFVVARSRGMQTGGIVGLIVINLIFGFVEPNIGWQAHIGGLIVGAGVAGGFVLAERWRGKTARGVEVATCLVAAAVMYGAMQFPCRHFT